jgi:hypothetical protein
MNDINMLPLLGFDWRDATAHLGCTRPELLRWIEQGKLPYDGRVHSYRFSSMSRSYRVIEGGWKPETIEKAKEFVEAWREEHKNKKQADRKTKRRADREIKKLNESRANIKSWQEEAIPATKS